MKTIKQLVAEAFRIASEKGWHSPSPTPLENHALFHSEIGEATEEVRKGMPAVYQLQDVTTVDHNGVGWERQEPIAHKDFGISKFNRDWDPKLKPEGELIELADVIIRIADYCGHMGWDLEKALELKSIYNETRSYRHGKKI